MNYKERLVRLRKEMAADKIDLMFLTPSANLRYLTGISMSMLERLACCIIGGESVRYIVPAFEAGSINDESRPLLECLPWADGEDPFTVIRGLIPSQARTAAIDRHTPSWVLLGLQALRPDLSWKTADAILGTLRVKKDDDEYRLLKRVQEKSCAAFRKLMEHGIRGLTEKQVQRLLIGFAADNGIVKTSPIVASGPNSAFPHHRPTDRVIEKGDPVVFDFGGEEDVAGYRADTTRTVVVGQIPDGFAEMYDIVLRAHDAAFEAARPGVPCDEVDRAGRRIIEQAGYGGYFTHRLGHGLGLDMHEDPFLAKGNLAPLGEGYCITDEPGIYVSGRYGVRIEDTLFIHRDGPERLTPLDRNLHIIA